MLPSNSGGSCVAKSANKQTIDEDELEAREKSRYFLIDLGFEAGETFCRRLLESGEFSTALLKKYARRGSKSGSKAELAEDVASQIVNDELDADAFMLDFCRQGRDWLCLRLGTKANVWSEDGQAIEFLTTHSRARRWHWYGPFGDGTERWYVAAKDIDQLVSVSDTDPPIKRPMRWHVIVQVTPHFAALHWFNASVREDADATHSSQFPFWHHINDVYEELSQKVTGHWDPEDPNLSELVLHTLMERYEEDRKYKWHHQAFRSMHDSVALNARSSRKVDGNAASGLETLTRDLALTTAKSYGVDLDDKSKIARAERDIRWRLLRERGTRSYEFTLDKRATPKPTRIARMRVSFGVDEPVDGRETPDTLQYIHCFASYGRSTEALKFILKELGLTRTGRDVFDDNDELD